MTHQEFTKDANDWNNHIFLLWLALEETKAGEVIEMGCGDGSTRQLNKYCHDNNRHLHSFDTDKEWLKRFSDYATPNHSFHYIENDWHIVKDMIPNPSVILIDHAPGERRIVDVKRFMDINGILVLHDTQPPPTAADYGYERIWPLFKYKVHLTCPVNPDPAPDGSLHNRTWASAVSNHYDVTKWRGLKYQDYEIK